MNLNRRSTFRAALMTALMLIVTIASSRLQADTGTCGGATTTVPFTDVAGSIFFCTIAEAYFSALTNGTTPTTYSPGNNVTRDQMSAFITRTLDQSLRRGSRRAALNQFWLTTPQYDKALGVYTVGTNPQHIRSDGENIWVTNSGTGDICAVRSSTGQDLGVWDGATAAVMPLIAMGKVFACGNTSPGKLYMLDPLNPPQTVTTLASNLGNNSVSIAFDGSRIWTANSGGSVSIVTPGAMAPWSVTTLTSGFNSPVGILFDGANIWIADNGDSTLKKLDSNGVVIQTVALGSNPQQPVFDGANIWVPTAASLVVVRANTGVVLATISGNGLNNPTTAAFDGERILITNISGNSVSLWKATDLTPLGSFPTGAGTFPKGACSDGVNFWITLNGSAQLARF